MVASGLQAAAALAAGAALLVSRRLAARAAAGGGAQRRPLRSELTLEVLLSTAAGAAEGKSTQGAGAAAVRSARGPPSSSPRVSASATVSSGGCGVAVVGRAGTERADVTEEGRCWLGVEDHGVSSRHLEARWSAAGGAWQVRDRGSLNGTLLNSASIAAPEGRRGGAWVTLADGDVLTLCARVRVLVKVSGAGAHAGRQAPRLHAAVRQVATVQGSAHGGLGPGTRAPPRPMEDVVALECPLRGCPDFGLFAVFDGHCGAVAATRAAAAFPEEISALLATRRRKVLREGDAAALLREAFAHAERRVLAEHKCDHEGCTATVALAWRDPRRGPTKGRTLLQVANVGDSSAVLGGASRRRVRAAEGQAGAGGAGAGAEQQAANSSARGVTVLTTAHTLQDAEERQRLARAGVELRQGERRLYGLAVSRVLGDGYLKLEDVGLTAEPSVSAAHVLEEGGGVLVMASDGLWDVTAPDEAVAIASLPARGGGAVPLLSSATLASDAAGDGGEGGASGLNAAVGAANLMGHACAKRSRDNVTVLVVSSLPALPTAADRAAVAALTATPRPAANGDILATHAD